MPSRRFVVPGAAVLAVLVVATGQVPAPHLSYQNLALRTAIEVTVLLIATLAAFLVVGRHRQSRSPSDLVLSVALGTMAFGQLCFGVLPILVEAYRPPTVATSLTAVAGAVEFVVVAWQRTSRHGADAPLDRRVLAVIAVGLTNILVFLAIGFGWPSARGDLQRRVLMAPDSFGAVHDVVLGLGQLVVAGLFALAAIGFRRRSVDEDDEFLLWIAVGCVFSAGSRVSFAVAGSPGAEWVTSGTLLRLSFYAVLICASVTEINRYWRQLAQVAVVEERRRLARDFHDGLAQQLAFVSTQARWLAGRIDHERVQLLAAAAERALDESRLAIAALTRSVDEPLDTALAKAVEEAAHRTGAQAQLRLDPGVRVGPAVQEALLRVVHEAVSNAGRHGGAANVYVDLMQGDGLRLSVLDDGRGFDVDGSRRRGFGLVSMRERIEALGGHLRVESELHVGTLVEAVVP